jgi:hypothetical protein
MRMAWAAALALSVVVTGCDKKDADVKLAPAASSLAASTPPPASHAVKFTITSKGLASIDMPAPNEHIKATADVAAGTLDVDLMKLSNSRGEVKMDLATLTTKTFDDEKKNASQTGHARTWLEVADGEDGKLSDEVKAKNKWAVFAIRAIEKPSAEDVTKVEPTKEGGDDVRTVTLTVKGELLIHGHKVERSADMTVAFHWPTGADPAKDKPSSVAVKSKTPLRVTLAEHDVKPRDGFGKIAKQSFKLLGTKVADTADITLELTARPGS